MFGSSLVGWEVRGGGEDCRVRDWVEVRAEGWRVGGERSRSVEWDVGGGKSIKNLDWRLERSPRGMKSIADMDFDVPETMVTLPDFETAQKHPHQHFFFS